jgi:hypothetical protein
MRRERPAASSTAAIFSEVSIGKELLTGMDGIDRICDFQFLIFYLWRRAAANSQSQIKNLKSKIPYPVHPVHPC